MQKHFKLDFIDRPDLEPVWFDTREELEATIEFLKSCQVDDGPVRLRITEYAPTSVEER